MDVKLPNGKVIRGVPEGTTKEEIQAKAIASGMATEQDFAPTPTDFADTKTATQQLASETNPFEAGLIAAGRGYENLVRGVEKAGKSGFLGPIPWAINKLAGDQQALPERTAIEEQAYRDLKEESPIATTVGEVLGEAAPLAPVAAGTGAMSYGPRIAANTFLGAAEGGLTSAGRGESAYETAANAGMVGATAGVIEAALPIAGRLVGETYRRLTGKSAEQVLDASGNINPQVQRVLDANGVNVDEIKSRAVNLVMENPENLEQATRMARFRQQGIPYTPGDITQDFKQRAKENRLSEIQESFADPLRDLRIKQSKRIGELSGELTNTLGTFGKEETGEMVKEGIALAENLSKGEVRTAYRKLSEAAGMPGGMPLPIDTFDNLFSSQGFMGQVNRLSPAERTQIQNTLIEFGIDTDEAAIARYMATDEPGVLGKAADITPLTTENSERFVQALNGIITPTSSNELRGVVGSLKGAADASFDLLDGEVGGEIVTLAKNARAKNVAYKKDFTPKAMAGKLIRLANDRTTPMVEASRVYNTMFGPSASIEQTRKTLNLLRRTEAGKKSIRALQGQLILDTFDAGFLPSSRMNGERMFSGNAAKRYFDKVGEDAINELFKDSPELADDFLSLLQTGVDITPSGKEVVKGSGSVILNMANQMADMTMANRIPMIGGTLSAISNLVRSGADQRQIEKILARSPQLKKQVTFIRENLPNLTAAMGLTAASAAAKSDEEK
tara:strand:+ start:10061 stop:12256 length:2196 start_codon:yes stop_codon:yes gene_type:complete